MEDDGDAAAPPRDLQSFVAAIKSTEVLDSRIALINELGDSYHPETSDLILLFELLITSWVDSTCSSISQCLLNKAILHVATKFMELETSSCPTQFVILGTKASIWCRKHLQITSMPSEECQDENHLELICQLILDTLSFSSISMSALTRSPILGEKVVMLIVEDFVLELLHLTKASILEIKIAIGVNFRSNSALPPPELKTNDVENVYTSPCKSRCTIRRIEFHIKIQSIASEVLKVAQGVLDAATKLCRAYFEAIGSGSCEMNLNRSAGLNDDETVDYASHVIRITACTIENLYELGIFAASGGGRLVTVLNVSWKGVVSLLQLGKGVLTENINVGDIILTLVSLAIESLRCAAETWSSTVVEPPAISEAKRTFLPIKFYLINAVRISSEYPCEALKVHREISRCVVLITSLGISSTKVSHLRAVSEALVEFLEPTSFLLLHTLLNATDGTLDSKIHVIDWLFGNETDTDSTCKEDPYMTARTSLNGIFYVNWDDMPRSEALMIGRLVLFLNLLRTSSVLREEIVLELCWKLGYLFDMLMHEYIYSSILCLQVPVSKSPGQIPAVAWQPMICFILDVLKTFMIVTSSFTVAWIEIQTFLLQNLLHPHFLCLEIVRELWCFFIRHAEREVINHVVDSLCLLLKTLASCDQTLMPVCPLRKMARSICILLSYADPATVDQVYNSTIGDEKSQLSTIMYVALLIEGFPLGSLSENLRALAVRKIVSSFYGYIASTSELCVYGSSGSCGSSSVGWPVLALSSALISCQITKTDFVGEKTISQFKQFTLDLIHNYRNAKQSMKDHYLKLLGAMLNIVSKMDNQDCSDLLEEVILELHSLCVEGSADSDKFFDQCKVSLASFLAGLYQMNIPDDEGNALCSAIWSLYHLLLRERHWAVIHLAIAAFGYFASRTSCTHLWRFVPQDAALSFETSTGNEANEDRFMSELKGYLEKDAALHEASPCEEQLSLLFKEGLALKNLSRVANTMENTCLSEHAEFNEKYTNRKKRKLRDGICEGMELLQKGLKTMSNALAEPDAIELKKTFSSHISCLEDVISHMVGLSDSCD